MLVFEDERTTSILMRHVMKFVGGALRRMVDAPRTRSVSTLYGISANNA